MYTKAKVTVVKSDLKGIYQHDPMSWQVVRNHFETVEAVASSSIKIDEIIKTWTTQFDYEKRAMFGEIFFSSLVSSGANSMSDITSKKVRSIAQISKEIQTLKPEDQQIVMDVFGKLLSVGGDSLKNTILSKLPKTIIMRKNEK